VSQPPFVEEYEINGIRVTSVVIDADEFESFCNELEGIFDVKIGARAGKEAIEAIRKEGHLPLMARGTKTEKFFERWGVKTDKMGVVRRGRFSTLLQQDRN